MRRFVRAEVVVFLCAWVALLVVGRSELFRGPGTLWHTVSGQRMIASLEPVRVDPFAVPTGRPWISMQWLAECAMAALHAVARFDTLLVATATLLAALYTWVAHRLQRAGLHPLVTTVIVMLVLGASSHQFHARPHLATIVLFAVTFASLVDVDETRTVSPRLALLVPVYVTHLEVSLRRPRHGGGARPARRCGRLVPGRGQVLHASREDVQR